MPDTKKLQTVVACLFIPSFFWQANIRPLFWVDFTLTKVVEANGLQHLFNHLYTTPSPILLPNTCQINKWSQQWFLQNQIKTFYLISLVSSFWLMLTALDFMYAYGLLYLPLSTFAMCIPISLQCSIHFLPQFSKVHCIDM